VLLCNTEMAAPELKPSKKITGFGQPKGPCIRHGSMIHFQTVNI